MLVRWIGGNNNGLVDNINKRREVHATDRKL